MLVTLFSDASMCSHRLVGGWAAWLKADRGSLRAGAPFGVRVRDTSMAEAMAVVNALSIGLKFGLIQSDDEVLVQTDNDSVMGVLLGTARRDPRRELKAKRRKGRTRSQVKRDVAVRNLEIRIVADLFRDMTAGRGVSVRWRHVKGHRGTVDRRAAVNSLCDEVARGHMRSARRRREPPDLSERHPDAGRKREVAA